MPLFSFFKKPSEELSLIFDIGSSSVAGALVKLEQDQSPQIIYTVREQIAFQENVEAGKFFSLMLKALERVTQNIEKIGLPYLHYTRYRSAHIRHVHYIFSSPWALSQTKIIAVEKEKLFEVTESYVNSIVAREEELFEKNAMATGGGDQFKEKVSVIERKIIQIKLNGYDTAHPYKKMVKSAEITFFISLVPKNVIESVEEVVHKSLRFKKASFYSFPLVSFSTIRDLFAHEDDFIFLDVGGELTDITIVKKGIILETVSFPMGKNFLIRRVADKLNVLPDVALSLLKIYFSGNCDKDVEQKMKDILADSHKVWYLQFDQALRAISNEISIPRTIFASINSNFVDFFLDCVKDEKYSQFSVSKESFDIILLDADHMKDFVAFGKDSAKDPFLALQTIFVNKMFNS